MFIAKISKGRTIGEMFTYTFIIPILYCMVWFCVWGGAGLRQARQAQELAILGEKYFNDSEYYLVPGTATCYDVPQSTVMVQGETIFENHLLGVSPVCEFDSSQAAVSPFHVLDSFAFPDNLQGLGTLLGVLFVLALSLNFVTSADSATLIVSDMSVNGTYRSVLQANLCLRKTHKREQDVGQPTGCSSSSGPSHKEHWRVHCSKLEGLMHCKRSKPLRFCADCPST